MDAQVEHEVCNLHIGMSVEQKYKQEKRENEGEDLYFKIILEISNLKLKITYQDMMPLN